MSLSAWALVALGGAVGASARYLLGHFLDVPGRLPWGTVLANLAGSFVLGLVVGLDPGQHGRALVGLGFCGALTTYSAFAVQTHHLGPRRGALLVLVTLPPAIALCTLGRALVL
ncbi:fluoride efflux transporter FluC [Nocardioides marmoribigeumensis]|uniref:Fluoride-specific ion channel FluC n=1 Tax=Nocardioides marmoribigeumensis TaxID=433649 RepID=A0ABU2BU44_9ACTN|nr:CrcB family protein [Nocardioides marmoribigeumensis]MDR7362148.1 CrcB protein [Nocardioides marmoribigeumensis]